MSKWPWLKIYFVAASVVLVFAIGITAGLLKLAPAIWLAQGYTALQDWKENFFHYSGLRPDKFIRKARPYQPGTGVTINAPAAYPGVTLISSMWDEMNGLNLIDMDGKVLNQWRVSFNRIWADAPDWPPKKISDWDVDIHGAVLYPDGSVVFNFEYNGLVKIDRCSQVIWKLAYPTHHSVELDDDGNLWVPSKRTHIKNSTEYPLLKTGMEEDVIAEISPQGKILREIPVLELFYKSDLLALLATEKNADLSNELTDPGHLNSVQVLSQQYASQFPLFNAGDILVSLRNLSLIMVIDAKTEKIKWWMTGPFLVQHDARFSPDGHITVLDNRGEVENPREHDSLGSRILALDPASKQYSILYRSTADNYFHTPIRGKQQVLPNGNILITEWNAGRAFEVNRSGTVVWNYLNRYDDDDMYEISQARRYDRHYADFTKESVTCPAAH